MEIFSILYCSIMEQVQVFKSHDCPFCFKDEIQEMCAFDRCFRVNLIQTPIDLFISRTMISTVNYDLMGCCTQNHYLWSLVSHYTLPSRHLQSRQTCP